MTMTYGELYGPAMQCQTQEEADAEMVRLTKYAVKEWGVNAEEAIKTLKSNLGYYSGYYGAEAMERVQRLFSCVHPIFGKV